MGRRPKNLDKPSAVNVDTDGNTYFSSDEKADKDKIRMNIWISTENLDLLREKAQHSGTNVAVLASLAVSDYCDNQRKEWCGVNLNTHSLMYCTPERMERDTLMDHINSIENGRPHGRRLPKPPERFNEEPPK